MVRQFSIWIVSPPGFPHSRCFEEVALALQEAFAVLGHLAPVVTDPAQIRGWAVVLGAHLLPRLPLPLPSRLILYNLEQITDGSEGVIPEYLQLLRRYPVWDYSARNIERLKTLRIADAALCGIGYMPGLSRIPPAGESIDVAFIGSLNQRRIPILEELSSHGKIVEAPFNVYGAQRDKVIAAAKIVLNYHHFEAQIFEIVRVSYLLANRKCVVSETGLDEALEAPFRDGVAFASYDKLVETCLRLLDDPAERGRLAERGFELFRAQSQVPLLERALAQLPLPD